MTPERRSTYPLCGAKKKNGETCRAFAGQGTTHLGTGRCKYHLGNTESHRTHAVKAEAQRHAVTMGRPISITASQALLALLRMAAGAVAWLHMEVAAQEGIESPEARALIELYGAERDRLARLSQVCLAAGISRIEVEMAEAQTEALTKAINVAMSHVGGLSNQQKKRFGEALRQELRKLSEPLDEGSAEPGVQLVPTAEAPPRTASKAAPVPA